jgi:hypothetical protein
MSIPESIPPTEEVRLLRAALNWALNWIDYCAERPLPEPEADEVEDWHIWQVAMALVGYPESEDDLSGQDGEQVDA